MKYALNRIQGAGEREKQEKSCESFPTSQPLRRGTWKLLREGTRYMHWSRHLLWIAGGAVVLLATGAPRALLSQTSSPTLNNSVSNSQLQLATSTLANGLQQIVILDSTQRTLAVYHVDGGNLQLRSVRSLVWDLRMEEFNGAPPLPSELRRVQP